MIKLGSIRISGRIGKANLSKTYEARIQKLTRERDDLSYEVHKLNIKVSMLQSQLISTINSNDNGI